MVQPETVRSEPRRVRARYLSAMSYIRTDRFGTIAAAVFTIWLFAGGLTAGILALEGVSLQWLTWVLLAPVYLALAFLAVVSVIAMVGLGLTFTWKTWVYGGPFGLLILAIVVFAFVR